MPPRPCRASPNDLLIALLCATIRHPSRQCRSHNVNLLRTSCRRRYASSSTPPSRESSKPSAPTPSTKPPPLPSAIAPASQIPMRMLLDRNPENRSAISRIPIPAGVRGEKFIPQPLARPLGLPFPPQPGQNSPVDRRTLAEKSADFSSYEKALERRRVLFRQFLRPYFQEWKRLDKDYKGKSFVSNERLFRREKALWFPNLWGATLRSEGDGVDGGRDLVGVLRGRVSVVGIQSGVWAEEQVRSFLGGNEAENPALSGLVEGSGGVLQRVDVNVQGDWVRQVLVRLFKGRLRRSMPEEQWERYFMVKLARDVGRGLTEDVRDAMGFLNSQVGYVYLLDTECRIRWAGSGHAWRGEVAALNMGIRRLLEEAREAKTVDGTTKTKTKTRVSVSNESTPREADLERGVERAMAWQ